MKLFNNTFTLAALSATVVALLSGCQADKSYPGVEYAPQMYHSVPYEPLSQVVENEHWYSSIDDYYNTSPVSPYAGFITEEDVKSNASVRKKVSNMLMPPTGTVKRQKYQHDAMKAEPMFFAAHPDSTDYAGRNWKNPLPEGDEQIVAEGKELYLTYCSACHGKEGKGDGKVGGVYQGVPNYGAGRYKTLSEGWIYHVITYGKGRMWPVQVQLNPEERWKVVRYVQQLQQGKP